MNTNIFNIRIYKKDGEKISTEDLSFVEDKLFNNTYYSDRKPISFSTPLICERSIDHEFIEVLIEPYKNYEFIDQVEEIHKTEKFDLWIIQMNESTDINRIWNFNDYGSPCTYKFDEIYFRGNKNIEKILANYFKIVEISPNQYVHKCDCEYLSSLCFVLPEDKFNLGFEDRYPLKIKENKDLYGKQNPPNNFYSSSKIYCFWEDKGWWKNHLELTQIEFRFKKEIVREYNNGEFDECKMYDSWHNCSDTEYIKYLENRENATRLT